MTKKPVRKQAAVRPDPSTTGHSWDGIEEFNNPLPKWWLYTLYACIVWAIGYSIAYPAWPLVKGATAGVLGYSSRAEVAADIKAVDDANASIMAELASADLDTIAPGSPLHNFAVNAGAAVFRANCSQCHGSGASGAKGYPNLLDDDWLWGGDQEAILTTVTHGIRNTTDDDARYSEMPRFGADGLLEKPQIDEVVQYVLQLSGQEHDATKAAAGATVFADNCASCHGEDGKGDRELGAPNLTDAIWLYGGDEATLTETVTNARFGVMPAWGQRLTEEQVKAVALYVHQLGGGE
ncbi:cytochrome-c oxidase, cbb3-type subunit III [Frigidibacter sp. ROC022]|uniref:cytochrome-c oxidase, cbb3-type subunit III n=1 Tax=Frigidibacter sp. ROC022 TaxID=2971796 RepID=UPI00215A37ED|nr:cytochrome-c oxidase, cbb3-type subunit III [Frigidibacter sp. ROC022]MCR8724214.1 cytochrome-c oxidase, cbb3-type subunit III [Frigidibacter sp. ROC022]